MVAPVEAELVGGGVEGDAFDFAVVGDIVFDVRLEGEGETVQAAVNGLEAGGGKVHDGC